MLMLNDSQKLANVHKALKAVSDGHIDVYTFTVVVANIVDPRLHSDTLFAIRQRVGEKALGQPNTGLQSDWLTDYPMTRCIHNMPISYCPDCGG